MDPPTILMFMIFIVVCLFITGGFALLLPLSRELARIVRERRTGQPDAGLNEQQLLQLRGVLEGIEQKLAALTDRQEFLEKILEPRVREQDRLPREPQTAGSDRPPQID